MSVAIIFLTINSFIFLIGLRMVNGGRIDPLAPVSLFNIGYFYSYFFSGFLLQYDFDNFLVYPSIYTKPTYPLAIYFIPAWLGLISFNFGYLAVKSKIASRGYRLASGDYERANRRLAVLPFAILLLAILSALAIFYALPIGLLELISNIEAWELLRNQAMSYWADANYLYLLPVYIGFFHLCVLSAWDPGRFFGGVLFILVFVSLVLIGSRALILAWVISLLVFVENKKGAFPRYFKYGVLGVVASLGAVVGIVQKITSDGAVAQDLSFPFNLFRRLQSSYEQFENLVNIINTDFSFDFGRSIFEDVFLTYMPRSIYPWKSADVGFLRAQNVLFYNDFWSVDRGTTYPVGVVAELYFNFWYIGIFVGMFGLGMLLKRIERLGRSEIYYLPVLCSLAGTFLAPHRTFGTLLLSVLLFVIFVYINKKLCEIRT